MDYVNEVNFCSHCEICYSNYCPTVVFNRKNSVLLIFNLNWRLVACAMAILQENLSFPMRLATSYLLAQSTYAYVEVRSRHFYLLIKSSVLLLKTL